MYLHSFPPVSRNDAKILILGSMPGKASLAANQYYAHPRNLFWPILAEVFNFNSSSTYHERCQSLLVNQIALWDVLRTCIRESSLDSDIERSSIEANDIAEFLQQHSKIHTVFFNGKKAEQVFKRYVLPTLNVAIKQVCLPSTSPANAGISYSEKFKQWQELKSSVNSDR